MFLLCFVLVRIVFAFVVVIGLALVLHCFASDFAPVLYLTLICTGLYGLYIGFVGLTAGLTQSVFLHSYLHGHPNVIFTVRAKFHA